LNLIPDKPRKLLETPKLSDAIRKSIERVQAQGPAKEVYDIEAVEDVFATLNQPQIDTLNDIADTITRALKKKLPNRKVKIGILTGEKHSRKELRDRLTSE
jgi:hypothetical protein